MTNKKKVVPAIFLLIFVFIFSCKKVMKFRKRKQQDYWSQSTAKRRSLANRVLLSNNSTNMTRFTNSHSWIERFANSNILQTGSFLHLAKPIESKECLKEIKSMRDYFVSEKLQMSDEIILQCTQIEPKRQSRYLEECLLIEHVPTKQTCITIQTVGLCEPMNCTSLAKMYMDALQDYICFVLPKVDTKHEFELDDAEIREAKRK